MTDTVRRAANGSDLNPREVLSCTVCGTKIGKAQFHNMLATGTDVICTRCLAIPSLHRHYYPACTKTWHDMWDHDIKMCSRAAARHYLKERSK